MAQTQFNKSNTSTILLYTKQINAKSKDGRKNISFTKFLTSYKGKKYDTIITNELKPHLEKDMQEKHLVYPINMTLEVKRQVGVDEFGEPILVDDYFTKHEKYTRNDGTSGDKFVLVITDYRSISQGKYENKRTLDDLD